MLLIKSVEQDRQIGDRRSRNAVEGVVKGLASLLPAGADLCDAFVGLKCQRAAIIISDRHNCYHQIFVTRRRAISNTLGPGMPLSWLSGTEAYSQFFASDRETEEV